jgi:hypothetical protein
LQEKFMKSRWFSSVAALLVGGGLAWAEPDFLPPLKSEAETRSPVPAQANPEAKPKASERGQIRTVEPGTPATDLKNSPMPVQGTGSDKQTATGGDCGCNRSLWAEPGSSGGDRVWVGAEYLYWWVRGNQIPPLIGRVPASLVGTELPPGAITPLFGDSKLRFEEGSSGGRFTLGSWLDDGECNGVEGSFFYLAQRHIHFAASGAGDPVVGPIFFDATNGRETIITPAFPSRATETTSASATEHLWGAELNYRTHLVTFGHSPLDLLAGVRYLDHENSVAIDSAIDFLGSGTRSFHDSFEARNRFYGGQLGASLDLHEGPWSLLLVGKLGLGGVVESVNITGFTADNFAGLPPRIFSGGILTATSNLGKHTHSTFAFLPEFTANLGYQITSQLRVFVGYNLLVLEHAVYPGDAMDVVNPANIRGLIVNNPSNIIRPLGNFREERLWAQGLNFGLEFHF